jgi:hypothetical protein
MPSCEVPAAGIPAIEFEEIALREVRGSTAAGKAGRDKVINSITVLEIRGG